MANDRTLNYLADIREGMAILAPAFIRLGNEAIRAGRHMHFFRSAGAADRWVHPPVKMNAKRQRRN